MGAMSIGAYPTYDLPDVANVTAADTVYGTTGESAGGGGGGQPIIGGSVVR